MTTKQAIVHSFILVVFLLIGIMSGYLYSERKSGETLAKFLYIDRDIHYLKEQLLLLKLADKKENEKLISYLNSSIKSTILILDQTSKELRTSMSQNAVDEAIASVGNYYQDNPQHIEGEGQYFSKDIKAILDRVNKSGVQGD